MNEGNRRHYFLPMKACIKIKSQKLSIIQGYFHIISHTNVRTYRSVSRTTDQGLSALATIQRNDVYPVSQLVSDAVAGVEGLLRAPFAPINKGAKIAQFVCQNEATNGDRGTAKCRKIDTV